MMQKPIFCPACLKPYKENEKGIFCAGGRGHLVFMSWEYLKGYGLKEETKINKDNQTILF